MSKTSYFLISVIICCFCVIAAYRGYQYYGAYIEKVNERRAEESTTFFKRIDGASSYEAPPATSFGALPADVASLQMQPLQSSSAVAPILSYSSQTASYEDPNPIPAAVTGVPKISDNPQTQAQISNVFTKYTSRPIVQQFNRDIRMAGIENFDLSSMNGPEFMKQIQSNPQMQALMLKYAQDPQFIGLMQEMANDPDIKNLTQKVQQEKRGK